MATAVGGASPALCLSTSTVDFGNQPVGTSSAPQPVTVTNGGSLALTITGVSLSGANPGDFSQTNNCITTLAPFAIGEFELFEQRFKCRRSILVGGGFLRQKRECGNAEKGGNKE